MKANLSKRFKAYFIDFIIVFIITTIISKLMKDSNEALLIKEEMAKLAENQINNSNSFMDFIGSYSNLLTRLIKENILFYYLEFLILIIYFQIIPIILKGKTIGFKLLKIKLIDGNENISFFTLLKRNLVINEFAYFILYISLLYLIPALSYFIILIILAIIQILVVNISIFMIKYRDDEKSIADILSGSSVIIES